jgi:uncharacterized membrane protein
LVVATAVEFVIALVVWAVVGSSRTGGWSWWVVGGGVGAGIAYLALFKAFAAGGQVGPVVALTALYPALATLFAWLVMKDGLTFRQAVGVAFAVLAAALLAK